jgi:hypothetical protein
MKINRIIWYRKFVDKLWDKHHVDVHEAEEALENHRRGVSNADTSREKMSIWHWAGPKPAAICPYSLSIGNRAMLS